MMSVDLEASVCLIPVLCVAKGDTPICVGFVFGTYSAALAGGISRLLKITGLFCKKAL